MLSWKGSHATWTCSSDSLSPFFILDISASEDSLNIGFDIVVSNDISVVIQSDLFIEELGIGDVTDSEEETTATDGLDLISLNIF